MTAIKPTIKLFTSDTDNTGIHINSLIIIHEMNNYHLHSSTGTTIYTFAESICLYVLSMDRGLGVIGLFAYMVSEPDYINSISLHNIQEIKDTLGDSWESMKPEVIVNKLIDYMN